MREREPVLVDLVDVEKGLRSAFKKLSPRLRVFLGAFVPALAVALFTAGPNLTAGLVLTIVTSAAVSGLNEVDPVVNWSAIGQALKDLRWEPPSTLPRFRSGGPT